MLAAAERVPCLKRIMNRLRNRPEPHPSIRSVAEQLAWLGSGGFQERYWCI